MDESISSINSKLYILCCDLVKMLSDQKWNGRTAQWSFIMCQMLQCYYILFLRRMPFNGMICRCGNGERWFLIGFSRRKSIFDLILFGTDGHVWAWRTRWVALLLMIFMPCYCALKGRVYCVWWFRGAEVALMACAFYDDAYQSRIRAWMNAKISIFLDHNVTISKVDHSRKQTKKSKILLLCHPSWSWYSYLSFLIRAIPTEHTANQRKKP